MNTNDSTHTFTAAIIGAGRVGGYHAKAQLGLGSRVIVYEPNEDRAQAFKEQYPGVEIAKTLEQAIDAADVVHICTPPMFHRETAIASIVRKKPTIIEKPLAFTLDDAVAIYRAWLQAKDTPVILATSFRIGPAFPTIYHKVKQGDIGTLSSLETSYVHDVKHLEPGKTWRKELKGPAFLYEGGSHGIDLNMWLADQPVKQVQAVVGEKKTRQEYSWDEDFAITLKYDDGLVGRVWVSASAPMPRHGSTVAAYGESGAFRVHSKESYYESYHDGENCWTQNAVDVELTMKTMDLMSQVFNDFINKKRADHWPLPSLEEGMKLMIVVATIEKALKSGDTEPVPQIDDVLSAYGA